MKLRKTFTVGCGCPYEKISMEVYFYMDLREGEML
jgi:hypothetical protein